MKIGIVGNGVVGNATARSLVEHVDEVRVYDVVKEKRTHDLAEVLDCGLGNGLVFVCLPTPQKEDRSCDLSFLQDFFASVNLTRLDGHHINFVLRSTVPVGTTRRFAELYKLPNFVHNPEFLTARCAVTDAHLPARHVIGVLRGTPDPQSVPLVNLYSQRFPGVPIHLMFSDASELVKLAVNSFFAVKVSYWNEVYSYCLDAAIDWTAVLPAILADGRIAHSHTQVPGPDGKRGFGGTCLPKDLANLADCILRAGLRPVVTRAAYNRNKELDRPWDTVK